MTPELFEAGAETRARALTRIATAGERFDLKGAEGVKTLGGLAQITRTAEGTPESTATAIESGIAQLLTKTGMIQSGKAFASKRKVEVFEGATGIQMIGEHIAESQRCETCNRRHSECAGDGADHRNRFQNRPQSAADNHRSNATHCRAQDRATAVFR